MPVKLYPFQKEGVKMIERKFNGRALLADEMGLGKTIQALTYLKQNEELRPAVIVCPASVKWTWEYEARSLRMISTILTGRKPPLPRAAMPPAPLIIVNYDILAAWKDWIKSFQPKALIIDECQYIQNPRAQRTKAVVQLGRKIDKILALSGTPMTNRPKELFPTLNLLQPKIYSGFVPYAFRYCGRRRTYWGWENNGATNLDELNQGLRQHVMIRRRKKDVLKDLPDKITRVIPMGLRKQHEYIEARDNFRTWLIKHHGGKKATRALKVEGLTQAGYLLRLTARLKAKSVVEWATRFLQESDEKLILFAIHKKMINVLRRRVPFKNVVVDGSVTGKKRYAAVHQFQHDKPTRLFIGNLWAAGVGITLTAARTVGFSELWWRPGDFAQASDRPHRIGQKQTVWINYLIAAGTFEEKLCHVLQQKQEHITATLDSGDSSGDINIMSLLRKAFGGKIHAT